MPPGDPKNLNPERDPLVTQEIIRNQLTQQPEAEAPAETVVEPQVGAGEAIAGGGIAFGGDPRLEGLVQEPKKRTGPFRAEGTIAPQLSPENQQLLALSQDRINQANFLSSAAELQAMGVAQKEMAMHARVNELSAKHAADLAANHFPRARQRIQDLESQVDEARALRVNPYNWHESIGRGGRVAAAFSLLTGQMAAGAGNPNSALKMMDSAIERDIGAQEQNIKNEFNNLKLQKGLLQDERDLFTEELGAVNTTRAIAYAALIGRIGAAKQQATNEAHRLSLETWEDHYNVKLLQAMAAAKAQALQLHVNGPIKNAHQLAVVQSKMEAFQQQLNVRTAQAAPAAPLAPAEPQLPAAPGRSAAVAARRPVQPRRAPEATPLPEGAPIGEPAARVEPRRVSPDRTRETLAEQQVREARELPVETLTQLGDKAAAGAGITPREVFQTVTKPARQGGAGVNPQIAKHGSFAMAVAKNANEPETGITTWVEALEAAARKRPIPNNGFQMIQDARVFAEMVPEPKRNQFGAGEPGDKAFELARDHWLIGQQNNEVFEAPSRVGGQQNSIQAGGRIFRLKQTSVARDSTPPGIKRYNTISEKLQQQQEGVRLLKRVADDLQKVGPTGIFNEEDGFQIPGLTTGDPTQLRNMEARITLAMQYIKRNDPTARISDQDLVIGQRAASQIFAKKFKFLDFVQSLDGDPSTNTVRQMIVNFLQTVAIDSQRAMFEEFENDLVPDHESMRLIEEETQERQRFLNTHRTD